MGHRVLQRLAWLDKSLSRLGELSRWLPFLDAYRTLCMAPREEVRRVFEGLQRIPPVDTINVAVAIRP